MSRLRVLEKENAELETLRESGRPAKVANLIALRGRHLARLHKENARKSTDVNRYFYFIPWYYHVIAKKFTSFNRVISSAHAK